mmetsp:Transcript_17602/g.29722  ORF Transcript_17602/g.29722 Transcript_17602/m.29722 type:complete len:107 (+) Transcript_17602:324-644(+)
MVAIFKEHRLDRGNQAIQAAMHHEKTVTLLNHLRVSHRDISAIIKLQRNLAERREMIAYVKRHQPVHYQHLIRIYQLPDVNTLRGEGIHKKNFHCRQRRGQPVKGR